MAYGLPTVSASGRIINTVVPAGVMELEYGARRVYKGVVTGGSHMKALLGPDLGYQVGNPGGGTSTNSRNAIAGLISDLNATGDGRAWKAGHLLNADLGGSGTAAKNLTALTAAANNQHRVVEAAVKNELITGHNYDRDYPNATVWRCVVYEVTVSNTPFAYYPSRDDMYSYAYEHIEVRWSTVDVDKLTKLCTPVGGIRSVIIEND